jgi:glucose-6-phosphate isomerase
LWGRVIKSMRDCRDHEASCSGFTADGAPGVDTLRDEQAIRQHFVAVSTHARSVAKCGIDRATGSAPWNWVGGSYSMESAVGLSVILAIGPENFRAVLAGSQAIDQHFRTAPLERNLPGLMALLDPNSPA